MAIVDPAILEAMLAYGITPTGPASPTLNEDLYKDQNSWLTGMSKGANAGTDLDYLTMTNQLQPGAYAPMSSYEPVDAPGFRLLNSYRQGTPLQRYIATMWEQGNKGAMEILTDLQGMIADPKGDPNAQAVIDSLPRATVAQQDRDGNVTGFTTLPQPDMNLVRDSLQKFETTMLSDPEYTVGPDGQPVKVETEDSAAMKAWHDAGFVSDPTATYDPWSFAPAGARERETAAIEGAPGAQTEYDKSIAEAKRTREEADAASATYQKWLKGNPAEGVDIVADRRQALANQPAPAVTPQDHGSRREEIPQRGGVADDAARFVEDPLASAGGFVKGLFGKAERLPGTLSRTAQNVDQWTENIAGSADEAVGDPLERYASGQEPIFHMTGSVSGTDSFGIPNWMTGNDPRARLNAQYSDPFNQGWNNLPAQGSGVPGRTVAGQPGATGGGGGRPGASPSDAVIGPNLSDVLTNPQMIAATKRAATEAQGRALTAAVSRNQSKKDQIAAANNAFLAKRAQALRQSMADQLYAQGRSPGRDEVAARNAAIYGMRT